MSDGRGAADKSMDRRSSRKRKAAHSAPQPPFPWKLCSDKPGEKEAIVETHVPYKYCDNLAGTFKVYLPLMCLRKAGSDGDDRVLVQRYYRQTAAGLWKAVPAYWGDIQCRMCDFKPVDRDNPTLSPSNFMVHVTNCHSSVIHVAFGGEKRYRSHAMVSLANVAEVEKAIVAEREQRRGRVAPSKNANLTIVAVALLSYIPFREMSKEDNLVMASLEKTYGGVRPSSSGAVVDAVHCLGRAAMNLSTTKGVGDALFISAICHDGWSRTRLSSKFQVFTFAVVVQGRFFVRTAGSFPLHGQRSTSSTLRRYYDSTVGILSGSTRSDDQALKVLAVVSDRGSDAWSMNEQLVKQGQVCVAIHCCAHLLQLVAVAVGNVRIGIVSPLGVSASALQPFDDFEYGRLKKAIRLVIAVGVWLRSSSLIKGTFDHVRSRFLALANPQNDDDRRMLHMESHLCDAGDHEVGAAVVKLRREALQRFEATSELFFGNVDYNRCALPPQPCKTRWGTLIAYMQSFALNFDVLSAVVAAHLKSRPKSAGGGLRPQLDDSPGSVLCKDMFEVREVPHLLSKPVFGRAPVPGSLPVKALSLELRDCAQAFGSSLAPLRRAITLLEGDYPTASSAYPLLKALSTSFAKDGRLTSAETLDFEDNCEVDLDDVCDNDVLPLLRGGDGEDDSLFSSTAVDIDSADEPARELAFESSQMAADDDDESDAESLEREVERQEVGEPIDFSTLCRVGQFEVVLARTAYFALDKYMTAKPTVKSGVDFLLLAMTLDLSHTGAVMALSDPDRFKAKVLFDKIGMFTSRRKQPSRGSNDPFGYGEWLLLVNGIHKLKMEEESGESSTDDGDQLRECAEHALKVWRSVKADGGTPIRVLEELRISDAVSDGFDIPMKFFPVAKGILAVPATAARTERVNSLSKTIGDRHTGVTPERLANLLAFHDYVRTQKKAGLREKAIVVELVQRATK